jgi:hypothetical protein
VLRKLKNKEINQKLTVLHIETKICDRLRVLFSSVAIGSEIPQSQEFSEFQTGLEYFIPSVLKEKYSFWYKESLDAFRFTVQRKTGDMDAEFIGLCLLITDQVWTPLHLRLGIYPENSRVKWLECKLGELGNNNEILTVPHNSAKETKLLYSVDARLEKILWAFTISLGNQSHTSEIELTNRSKLDRFNS